MRRQLTIPEVEMYPLELLPTTRCKICGKDKINGLFTPAEVLLKYDGSPRCRVCIGEVNYRHRPNRDGQFNYMRGGTPSAHD